METKYGFLKGIEEVEYYKNGMIRACRVNEKNELKTPIGTLIPQYETRDERRKMTGTLEFYEDGFLMSICLDEQIFVETKSGKIPAEKILFYRGDKIKRVFPLNGKLSGYWCEENEYSLAETIKIKNGANYVESKFISIAFYESEQVKSLTFWPKERIELSTDIGLVKVRTGVSFYEDGKIKSFEPAMEIEVKTPIGNFFAFNNEVVGLNGDDNSVKLHKNGEIKSFFTCSDKVRIIQGEIVDVIEPILQKGWCNELIQIPIPTKVNFIDNHIVFNGTKIYDISQSHFFIENIKQKIIFEKISC